MFFKGRGKQDADRKGDQDIKRDAFLDQHFAKEAKDSSSDWRRDSAERGARLRAGFEEKITDLDSRSGQRVDHHEIDNLIGEIIGNNADGLLTPLLKSAVQAWIRSEDWGDFQNWSHSVCHKFEHCRLSKDDSSSVLDFPEVLPDAAALVNEAGRRAVEARRAGCFDRLLRGVVTFNMRESSPESLDEPLVFKPEILSDKELIEVLWKSPALAAFCEANSMREFIEKLALVVSMSEKDIYPPSVPLELLSAVQNEANHESIAALIKRGYERLEGAGIEASEVVENFRRARAAQDLVRGVFVDVEGTLIATDWESKAPKLTETAQALVLLCPSDAKVTVFSGGNVEELTETLRGLGFPEQFLPVRPKSEFKGQKLEVLIDDTPPEMQGFGVLRHVEPSWGGRSLIEADLFGTVAEYKARKAGGSGVIDLSREDL